jgi:hypothetical protein
MPSLVITKVETRVSFSITVLLYYVSRSQPGQLKHPSFIFSWLPGASAVAASESDRRWHIKEICYDGHDDALFHLPSHFWHHWQYQTWK